MHQLEIKVVTNKLVHIQTIYLQTSYAHFKKYAMPVSFSEIWANKMLIISSTRAEFLPLYNTQMLYRTVKRNPTAVTRMSPPPPRNNILRF